MKTHCFGGVHLNHPLLALGDCKVFSSSMLSPSSNVFHKCPNTKAYDYTPWEAYLDHHDDSNSQTYSKLTLNHLCFPIHSPWQPTHTTLPDSSPTHAIPSKQHYTNLSAILHQSGTLKLGQRGEGGGDGRELGGHVGSWCLSPTSRWLTDCHQQLTNRWTGVWIS
jgi:hypothetical protein